MPDCDKEKDAKRIILLGKRFTGGMVFLTRKLKWLYCFNSVAITTPFQRNVLPYFNFQLLLLPDGIFKIICLWFCQM